MPVIPLQHDMISLEICFIQSAPFIPTVYIQITLNPVAPGRDPRSPHPAPVVQGCLSLELLPLRILLPSDTINLCTSQLQ